jgi:hypothetical protein
MPMYRSPLGPIMTLALEPFLSSASCADVKRREGFFAWWTGLEVEADLVLAMVGSSVVELEEGLVRIRKRVGRCWELTVEQRCRASWRIIRAGGELDYIARWEAHGQHWICVKRYKIGWVSRHTVA